MIVKNRPEEKHRVLAALQSFGHAHHLPLVVFQAADLALEEHLTNVIKYAYDDGLEHDILVRFNLERAQLIIEVEDDGRPFNPLQAPEADTSIPLDQRPVGGLGIHLIRRFMDRLASHHYILMTGHHAADIGLAAQVLGLTMEEL